jgi:hypothetical protein
MFLMYPLFSTLISNYLIIYLFASYVRPVTNFWASRGVIRPDLGNVDAYIFTITKTLR